MKKGTLLTIGLAIAGGLALASCGSDPTVEVNTGPDQNGILVAGHGEVMVSPDTGRVSIGVEVTARTVAQSRREAAEAAGAVIDSVKTNGVADEDVRTVGLSIYPDYRYPRDGERELVGFVVSNTVSVTVRDLDSFSDIIDDAVEAGGDATRLQSISFDVEDRDAAVEQARDAAMEDARKRAEQLAEAAGVELGDALSINEVSYNPPSPIRYDAAGIERSGGNTPIEPGSTAVTVDIQVRWAID
ncbi:MAG: SIMPL domain-containing protein [Dehalococcoidia bacterium]